MTDNYAIYNNEVKQYLKGYRDETKVVFNWKQGAILGIPPQFVIRTLNDMGHEDTSEFSIVPYKPEESDLNFDDAVAVDSIRIQLA